MQVILTQEEYEELVDKSKVKRAISAVLYDLRCGGIKEDKYNSILQLFKKVGELTAIDINEQ